MAHEFFPNTRVITLAAGTFINTTGMGGTAGGVTTLGDYEYHAIGFYGTFANNGTINVYACENSAGSSPRQIASLAVGSGNGQAVGIDLKSDVVAGTFAASGTNYAWLTAAGTVEASGTWRGALCIHSTWPRSAGTTAAANGLLAYGTALT